MIGIHLGLRFFKYCSVIPAEQLLLFHLFLVCSPVTKRHYHTADRVAVGLKLHLQQTSNFMPNFAQGN